MKNQLSQNQISEIHSVLKLLTELAIAALIARKLTVAKAINKAKMPASANTPNEIFTP